MAIGSAISLIGFVIVSAIAPFGRTKNISAPGNGISDLGPANRVVYQGDTVKQIDNAVYATAAVPLYTETAEVSLTYKNPYPNQDVFLGFRDRDTWHYASKLIDSPLMNTLEWPKIGNGPYLYQKSTDYSSIDSFLKKPPKDKTVGIYDYTNIDFLYPDITLPEYSPSESMTTLDVPLRGKFSIYAYLEDEEFRLNISKRDLNWYSDPDPTKITVYKQADAVFTAEISDDGNERDNREAGSVQTAEIKNPGPELPENGVYKIVVENSDDSVITSITTNLHKVMFEGPIKPITNAEVYSSINKKTTPNKFYTNAKTVNTSAYHEQALQTVTIGSQSIELANTKDSVTIQLPSTNEPAEINVPKSDIKLSGVGFFALKPEQLFEPSEYRTLKIEEIEDFETVDYVLTNYEGKPKKSGDWTIAKAKFSIKDAYMPNGSLSWLLSAPGLKESGRNLEIKSLDMSLHKPGWWQ